MKVSFTTKLLERMKKDRISDLVVLPTVLGFQVVLGQESFSGAPLLRRTSGANVTASLGGG
jgi:hypothetical protein